MALAENVDIRPFARSLGTVMTFETGDVIFCEKDLLRVMYVVLDGAVDISTNGKQIEAVGTGGSFGPLSLVDGQPTPINARAGQRCEIALIDQRKFRYMVEELPNFVWYVMGELAHRLRMTNAKL